MGTVLAESSILQPGEVLGGFRVYELIGIGGTAIVYRAEQLSLGRPVALKVLSNQTARDDVFRERFRREAKHLAAFEHPHIVPVHDSGEHNGLLYMAMRLVEGTNLAEMILDRQLSADHTIDILRPIAGALDAAHSEGLVHRDVKPQNVLITERGHPYLADFGVAKGSNTHGLTATGGFVGTVNYASPEQIHGAQLTAASDIYALTAVLYHCLTGEVPYPRENDVAVMHAHLHEPPPSLPGASGENRELRATIARGMAKDPDARHQYAWELLGDAAHAVGRMSPSRRKAAPAFPPPAGTKSARVTGAGRAKRGRPTPELTPTAADPRGGAEVVPVVVSLTRPRSRMPLLVGATACLLAAAAVAVLLTLAGGAKTAAAHHTVRDLNASLAPALSAQTALPRRPQSARSLSATERRLAEGDIQAAALLSKLRLDAGADVRRVATLISSLRGEASDLDALAAAAESGHRSAYTRSLRELRVVQSSVAGALRGVTSAGLKAPSLPGISPDSLALPAPRRRAARRAVHHASTGGTVTGAPAYTAPVTSAPSVAATPQVEYSAPAVATPPPAQRPSHTSPQYGHTVVAPPVE